MRKLLINAHTHLEFSDRGYLCPSEPIEFTQFLRKVVKTNPPTDSDSYKSACERGVSELLACGTNWVADISKTGFSVEPLVKSGLSGIVYIQFLGEDLDRAMAKFKKVKAKIRLAKKNAKGSKIKIGLCFHSPYSVNPLMWKLVLSYCKKNKIPICIHVAESPGEFQLFTKGTGSFRKFEKDSGLPPLECLHLTPIQYLSKVGALKLKPLLIHVVEVDDRDIELIKKSGSSVVHCPRSNKVLGCGRMPLEKFLKAGVEVYLGTDSLLSSPSLNIKDEAEFAVSLHKGRVSKEKIQDIPYQNKAPV